MESQIRDLWPEIARVDFITPVGILRQQASILGDKTNNIVEGEVKTTQQLSELLHILYLVAPAMDHYRYALLSVSHPTVELYPATILFGPEQRAYKAKDENEFIQELGGILSSDKTKSIIQALIAQSQT